jgi:hypothetical protein
VDSLQDHWDLLPPSRRRAFAEMAGLALAFMRSAGPNSAAKGSPDVARLLARIAANAHTLCDEELRPYGVGLFPLGALANHSPNPSAVQMFGPDRRMVFRALRELAPGEEVTISYVELAASAHEQREALLSQYRFDPCGTAPPYRPAASWPSGAASPADSVVQTEVSTPKGPVPVTVVAHARPYAAVFASDQARDPPLLRAQLPASSTDDAAHEEVFVWGQVVEGPAGEGDEGPTPEESFPLEEEGEDRGARAGGQARGERVIVVHLFSRFEGGDMIEASSSLTAAAKGVGTAYAGALLALAAGEAALSRGDPAAAAADLARAEALCSGSGRDSFAEDPNCLTLVPTHVLRVRVRAALLRTQIDLGDFASASDTAHALLPSYRALYPPHLPPLSLHLATIAKLDVFLERDPALALGLARESLRSLSLTHPARGAVVGQVQDTLAGAAEALASSGRRDDD